MIVVDGHLFYAQTTYLWEASLNLDRFIFILKINIVDRLLFPIIKIIWLKEMQGNEYTIYIHVFNFDNTIAIIEYKKLFDVYTNEQKEFETNST